MSYKTPVEVLTAYSQHFSGDAPVVQKLTEGASNLHSQWRTFLYLFSGPKERIDLLNAASGRTAILLQSLLWDSVLLRVRRMTDPKKQRKFNNLSVEHLVGIAKEGFGVYLESSWDDLLKICEPSRVYADKYIAHSDLSHSLGDEESTVLRKQTTDAVVAIGEFVRNFHVKTRNTDIQLMPVSSIDDERMLILRLYQGCKAAEEIESEKEKLLNEGRYKEAFALDFSPPEWIFKPYGF